MRKLCWLETVGMTLVLNAGFATGIEPIRQPPSVLPLPVVSHASIFDLQCFALDPEAAIPEGDVNEGTQIQIGDIRLPIYPRARSRDLLRFVRAVQESQTGSEEGTAASFPSNYLTDDIQEQHREQAAASIPNPPQEGRTRESPAYQARQDEVTAPESNGLREVQAVPADQAPAAGATRSLPSDGTETCPRSGQCPFVPFPGEGTNPITTAQMDDGPTSCTE